MSNTVNNYTETDLGNISLNPRGEYDNSAAYEYLDTVSYQGGSYFCLAELETTITGIAPDAGRNSEYWQMIAAPGDMTPEYTVAYNDVINKAVQVETSRAAVELAQQEIEAVQTDVQQLHSDTVQAAQEAENSKNSAANSAQSAEQSRKTVSESEQNIKGQITGFDSRVSEAVEQSKEEINTTKQQAINTITNQQDASVNIVKTEGEKIITRVGNDAKTVADDRATVEEAAQTVLNNAQEVAQNTQTVAGNMENAAASAESAKTSADNATQSAKSVEDASKQIEQNKKDVASLKVDKITKPAEAPSVGKILRVKSVNEDGTFVCEWADGASNLDVQIDGQSIVQDGVAEIPVANGVKYGSSYGLVHFVAGYCYGIETGTINISDYKATDGIKLVVPSKDGINRRMRQGSNGFGAITTNTFDDAVKAAMCDGKGAAWTAEEQAAARERMGIDEYEDILDVTLQEDSIINIDFNNEYKSLYVYIDQTNVTDKITGITYINPKSDSKGVFGVYNLSTTSQNYNLSNLWYYTKKMTYRISSIDNIQSASTGNNYACIKAWDKNNYKNYPDKPFNGLSSAPTVFHSGTRIVVKGVRA